MNITVLVVTFNRKHLLKKCLLALSINVTGVKILVIDNASSDGTRTQLEDDGWLTKPNFEYICLPTNTGGAGGFSYGINHAIHQGAEWVWMMDDDAEPHPFALERLAAFAKDENNIYGSLATNKSDTSWLTTVIDPPLGTVGVIEKIPDQAVVQSIPFLGFMIHRSLVARIGLPDPDFFIAADDIEYCLRAQRAGSKIIIIGSSRIEHPKSRPSYIKIFGKKIIFLSLPPWKRYYDTRNRLLIAKKYYGIKLLTHTIPGSIIRLLVALIKEPKKLAQVKAFSTGFYDGLFSKKGKRHEYWGIK